MAEDTELAALRERVEALENIAHHQAALLIVLYNGLYQASTLMLDLTSAPKHRSPTYTYPPLSTPPPPTPEEERVRTSIKELGAIFTDLHHRLEPMREYLTDTDPT